MNHVFKIATAVLLFCAGNFSAFGQYRAPGGLPPGFHHALLDVLTGGSPFSARARISLVGNTNRGPSTMSAKVAVLSGCMRFEVDGFNPGPNVPASEVQNLRDLQSVMILRPDTNRMYLLYPSFRSYVEMAYSRPTGMEPSPQATMSRTPLGRELVGGRMCDKALLNFKEANGETYNVTVWTSTNSYGFPIQLQMGTPPAIVQFEDLHFEPPDPNLFLPPAGYYKYEGIQELILKETQKAQNTNSQ